MPEKDFTSFRFLVSEHCSDAEYVSCNNSEDQDEAVKAQYRHNFAQGPLKYDFCNISDCGNGLHFSCDTDTIIIDITVGLWT